MSGPTAPRSGPAGEAYLDVTKHGMAVYPDQAVMIRLGYRRNVVGQVTPHDAAGQLYLGTFRHVDIDVAQDRIGVDSDLGGGAADIRQIDRHVAQKGDRNQLVLDVPGLRSLPLPPAFKDWLKAEKPSAALARVGLRLIRRVAVHGAR